MEFDLMLFSSMDLFILVKIDSSLRPPLPFIDLVIHTVLFSRSLWTIDPRTNVFHQHLPRVSAV